MISKPNDCPGCNHSGELTTECDVYKEYGKGKHWFIQPASEGSEGFSCEFCGAFSDIEDDLWGDEYDD